MAIVGWIELILIVAVLIFLGIIYQVYWVKKRKLAVGFIFLIIGSALFLCIGISSFLSIYVNIEKGEIPILDPLNILLIMAWNVLWTGLGVYGLVSAYRNLRTVFGILKRRKKGS